MTYFRSVSRIFSNLSGFRRRATPPRTLPDASKTLTPPNPTPVLSKHSRVPFSSTSSNRPSSRSPSTGFTKLAITGQVIYHRLAAMTGAVLYYQFRRSAHQPPAKSPTESLVQTKLTQIQKYFKPNFSSSVVEAHTSSVASNDPIEDRFSVHQFGDKMIFGIYDGHAGWDCADTLEKFFHTYIGKYLSTLPTTSEALLKAYDQFDQHLMRLGTLAKEDFEKTKVVPSFSSLMPAISGSVLVTAVVSKHQIDVAHAGDCRAILGRKLKDGQWVAIELTKDHDADNPKEKERIQQEHPGEEVISKKRVLGGLQPFRAMGDARYKWPIELQKWIVETYSSTGYPYLSIPANYHTPPYVTAHPEVSSVPITEEDMFLVLATDGLWERATNDQVVDIVAEYMEGPKEKSKWAHQDESAATHVIRNVFGGKDSEAVASLLKIPPPLSRFFRDDITITVVFLKPFPSKTSLNYTDPPIAGAQEINLPSKL